MSTKPLSRNGVRLAAALALSGLAAACAGPAPEAGHSFGEVRLHRIPPPAPPPYLQAQAAPTPPVAPEPGTGASDAAVGRVLTLLRTDGFTVETRRDGAAWVVSATRMGAPTALRSEAVCALKAMHRPDFSASDLDVRLGAGSSVDETGRFVLVDTNLISGDLTRQTCRSNGALEAAVRRAAAG